MRHVTIAQRVAARFQRRGRTDYTDEDFLPAVAQASALHEGIQDWLKGFPRILAQAQGEAEGLPDGWVWQPRFSKMWDHWSDVWPRLQAVDDVFDWIYLSSKRISTEANVSREATYDPPPPKARIEYGFSKFDFFPDPKTGKNLIAYPVDNLQEWHDAMTKWSKDSVKTLKTEARKAKRKLRR